MSFKLLREEEALRKIELSLKLNGKAFHSKYLNCANCKFRWNNGFYTYPQATKITYLDPITGQPMTRMDKPPKYGWYCYKYKGYPYHACLRFNVQRTNAAGLPVPIRNRWIEPVRDIYSGGLIQAGYWTKDPQAGEKDTLVYVKSGYRFNSRVCRRFESTLRENK